jgi:hypothetical protein
LKRHGPGHLSVSRHTLVQVPGTIKPVYRWYNVPPSGDPSSGDNPLNHIRWTATREDYVALLLASEHPEVEAALLEQLLEDTSA